MIEFISHDPAAKTFTLSVNGRSRTYPADKEGKRQAILDGLDLTAEKRMRPKIISQGSRPQSLPTQSIASTSRWTYSR